MTAKVFIDGEVGTTGLQIRARLENRPDISLISLPEENRKSRLSRIGAFGEADIAILCLPDAAVHEIAPDLREGRLIRVLPEWAPPREIIHVVFPSRRGLLPSVRALVDFLVDRFQALQED